MKIIVNAKTAKAMNDLANGAPYERTEGGLYLPKQGVTVGGRFGHQVIRNGKALGPMVFDHNIVVNEGLDYLLDVGLSAASQLTSWYIGLFKGNYTPLATNTGATIAGAATEATEYDEATRQAWTEAGVSSQTITNTASKATFTINDTITAYGAFLVSSSTKSGTSGKLFAAARFSASRSLIATDELLVTYQVQAQDDGV